MSDTLLITIWICFLIIGYGYFIIQKLDKIIHILNGYLGNAEDNLFRAKLKFKGLSQEELDAQYGQSGKTCQEILEDYKV